MKIIEHKSKDSKKREEKRSEMLSQIMRLNSLSGNWVWNPYKSSLQFTLTTLNLNSNLIDEVQERKNGMRVIELSLKTTFV